MIAYANVKAETSSLRFASWDGDAWKTETLEGIHGLADHIFCFHGYRQER